MQRGCYYNCAAFLNARTSAIFGTYQAGGDPHLHHVLTTTTYLAKRLSNSHHWALDFRLGVSVVANRAALRPNKAIQVASPANSKLLPGREDTSV